MTDTPIEAARRFFSEEPWWLENMVERIIAASDADHIRVVETPIPEGNDVSSVYAMLYRMNGGEVPTSAEGRSLADYVLVEQWWTIHKDGHRMQIFSTREFAERHVRDMGGPTLALYIVEPW